MRQKEGTEEGKAGGLRSRQADGSGVLPMPHSSSSIAFLSCVRPYIDAFLFNISLDCRRSVARQRLKSLNSAQKSNVSADMMSDAVVYWMCFFS